MIFFYPTKMPISVNHRRRKIPRKQSANSQPWKGNHVIRKSRREANHPVNDGRKSQFIHVLIFVALLVVALLVTFGIWYQSPFDKMIDDVYEISIELNLLFWGCNV